jgi:hypothetical protein
MASVLIRVKTCGTDVKFIVIVAFISDANMPVEAVDEVNRTESHFV